MSKKTALLINSVALGGKANIYLNVKGEIAFTKTARTLATTVLGYSYYGNPGLRPQHALSGKPNPDIYSVLIGWKSGEQVPDHKPGSYDRYGHNRIPEPIARSVNHIRNKNNKNREGYFIHGNRYHSFVKNVDEYSVALWVASYTPIASIPQENVKLHPNLRGNFSFIKASEIQPEDTVAWIDSGKQVYATIRDVEECEGVGDAPMLALQCDVYDSEGMRTFTGGYQMQPHLPVILIKRSTN